jgi:CRP-like cAMP-binding protein
MAVKQNSNDTERLTRLPFFEKMAAETRARVMDDFRTRHFKKGENIFLQGDAAAHFYIVQQGWIKATRPTAAGEEAIAALYAIGDAFGDTGLAGSTSYTYTAAAAEDSDLLEIPAAALARRAGEDKELLAAITAAMAREMHKLQMENEHLTIMSAAQRVGCLLLQLSSGMLGNGGTYTMPYDKSLAAGRLGMSAETFSRALAQLKAAGVTVKGPEVTIDNFGQLAKFCCDHCSAQTSECRGARSRLFQITPLAAKNRDKSKKD